MSTKIRINARDIKFYPGEPWAFFNDPSGPVIKDLDRRMRNVENRADSLVGVDSGYLQATIHRIRGFQRRGPYVDVQAGARQIKYTMAHHDGTPPHVIRVRKARALRFESGGKVIFRTKVNHPGTKGTFFLTRALPLAAN